MSGLPQFLRSDPYFLSLQNPIATADERVLADDIAWLQDHPEVKRARATSLALFRNAMAYAVADQMDIFDEAIEEFNHNFVVRAVNCDGAHPKIVRNDQPPHRWFGHDMIGARWGGGSPNFTYRVIPIWHGYRYEVRGWATCDAPATFTFTLMPNMPVVTTVDLLDSLDVMFEPDGSFVVTIDAEPHDGQPNHLQTKPGEMHLLIRDAVCDWVAQTPYALKVRVLDGPDRKPLDVDEKVGECVKQMLESVYYGYYCTQTGYAVPPNHIRGPASSGLSGGMPPQWGAKGNLVLEEDEALIATANNAGASFRDTQLCDMFFRARDYWESVTSLNSTQMAPDEDGQFTYVVAHRDPGVHNWLDTGGRRRSIYGHRWQAFSRTGPTDTPRIATRVVKFDDLDRELPAGVARIDATGRKTQIARRTEGFNRRFVIA